MKPAGGSRAPHQGCEDLAGRQDQEQGWASGSDGTLLASTYRSENILG